MDESPPSPSLAVARATMAMRGKRSGVVVDLLQTKYSEDDGQDVNEFYAVAKTRVTQESPSRIKESTKQKKKKKNNYKPRFSLPGLEQGEEEAQESVQVSKYVTKVASTKGKSHFSPGDVSRASTAPTTPGPSEPTTPGAMETPKSEVHDTLLTSPSSEHREIQGTFTTPRDLEDSDQDDGTDEDIEVTRISPDERKQKAQERAGTPKSPAFHPVSMTTEPLDEEDDLIPPPPPDEPPESDIVNPPDEATPRVESEEEEDQRNGFSDDDDKEGSGFQLSGTPGAPSESDEEEQERVLEKKRRVKETLESRRREVVKESRTHNRKEASQMPKASRLKKKARFVSPQGVQSGDREFSEIPLAAYKHSPDDKYLRRSSRAKCKPLAYWKNERIIYGPNDNPDVMGLMPVPVSILQAEATPYKKIRRTVKIAKRDKRGSDSDSDDSDPPFDSTKLRKKYDFNDGEIAHVWDSSLDDSRDLKVISYTELTMLSDLPLLGTRRKPESKVVGKAGQAFNIPNDENGKHVGYIMGSLVLPPTGIKDAESVGPCSQIFTVCACQPGALEVAFSNPDEHDGTLHPKTASRFLLNPHDVFRVPPENTYRLENHSTTKECFLTWVIIRPWQVSTNA